jgi:hypothetical protein
VDLSVFRDVRGIPQETINGVDSRPDTDIGFPDGNSCPLRDTAGIHLASAPNRRLAWMIVASPLLAAEMLRTVPQPTEKDQ